MLDTGAHIEKKRNNFHFAHSNRRQWTLFITWNKLKSPLKREKKKNKTREYNRSYQHLFARTKVHGEIDTKSFETEIFHRTHSHAAAAPTAPAAAAAFLHNAKRIRGATTRTPRRTPEENYFVFIFRCAAHSRCNCICARLTLVFICKNWRVLERVSIGRTFIAYGEWCVSDERTFSGSEERIIVI